MFKSKILPNPPSRLKTPKNDIAPMLFFPDVIASNNFTIPVLPIPFRLDRMSNGLPTLIIVPDLEKITNYCREKSILLDFKTFYMIGLRNFVNYGQKKTKEITFRALTLPKLNKWFSDSLSLNVEIPSLIDEATFILIEFLNLMQDIDRENLSQQDERFHKLILVYLEKNLQHFREMLTLNAFTFKTKNDTKTVPIYKEKKGKCYPEIIQIEVCSKNWKNPKQMNLVPYLFYDDIIDCYAFNFQKATSDSKEIWDISLFFHYEILKNQTTLKNLKDVEVMRSFKLTDLTFESIMTG